MFQLQAVSLNQFGRQATYLINCYNFQQFAIFFLNCCASVYKKLKGHYIWL